MLQRTILIKYGNMTVQDGKLKKSRLVWRGAGIEFFVIGSLSGTAYETAANLAMHECTKYHIPLISLRKQGR